MQTAATHTIDGDPVEGVEFFDVINPATASAFARAPDASLEQLELAVTAARRAFEKWRAVPVENRRTTLRGFAQAIRAQTQELAQLLTREQGKPLTASLREIEATAFCHQMVRSIVGTVVAAGRAEVRAGDIRGILRSGERSAAAPIAPPEGLCLWHVDYDSMPRLP